MLLLIQMSGLPGTGKTTLAREIGRHCGTVVLDHDITKTALLDGGVAWETAGPASYETLYALARSLLNQGHSVVLDSPCFYQRILDEGLQMVTATGACYRYVECVVEDLAEISRRLRGRTPLRSQRRDLGAPPTDAPTSEPLSTADLFREWNHLMKRPAHSYLQVDTTRPLATYLPEVLAFLTECEHGTIASQLSTAMKQP